MEGIELHSRGRDERRADIGRKQMQTTEGHGLVVTNGRGERMKRFLMGCTAMMGLAADSELAYGAEPDLSKNTETTIQQTIEKSSDVLLKEFYAKLDS